ncbi:hypothetical protein EG835_01365, partial [bacterium]|nr:hypothetical protein [bacterium]
MDKSRSRKVLDAVNVPIVLWAFALIVYGTIVVGSATSGMTGGSGLWLRHIIGAVIGLVPLALAWAFDYTRLRG